MLIYYVYFLASIPIFFFGKPIDITIRIQYQTQKTVCDLITKFIWKLKDAAVKIS